MMPKRLAIVLIIISGAITVSFLIWMHYTQFEVWGNYLWIPAISLIPFIIGEGIILKIAFSTTKHFD